MSILIMGKSACPICGQVINQGEQFYSFPPFVINTKEPIYYFNDSSFHSQCLTKHKLSATAIKFAELFLDNIKPSKRICVIKGNLITQYENHIFFDLLTTDNTEFLFKYNFAHIDKSNLHAWQEREIFIEAVKSLLSKPEKWREVSGDNLYLHHLLHSVVGIEGEDKEGSCTNHTG